MRTVKFTQRKVDVRDEITNLHSKEKLGLLVENTVKLEDPDTKVRLAGIPDVSINQYYSPGNPSVYVAKPNVGLGLICEDDIFRNQATLFVDAIAMKAGMRTDKLCIPASGSYTLHWSVYPVASHDYYDFINLVREDWGSNYTVEGAWTFFNADSIIETPLDKLREQFTRLGIKRACSGGGWVDHKLDRSRIGFGAGVLEDYWASMRDRLRRAAEKIRLAAPDCKVYVYYDTQRDTSEDGQEQFKDSWLTDEKGNQVVTEWGGKYSLTRSVVATTNNSFGTAMLAAVNKYFQVMKIDGLYWDEMEAIGFGNPLVTYNAADGFSCELDPKTFTIKREIGINTIMGEDHRIAVINRVRALDGDFMGNGPTSTKAILALRPQRMVEIQHNDYWHYEGNLDTPLGYAASNVGFDNWVRALNMATLLVGTRYNYDYDIQAYIFPFTPIELYAGYLLGKERIIATHSGNYGWQGDCNLVQVSHFNTNGKLVEKEYKTTIGNEARTEASVKEGEAVVMVRLPVSITPREGLVTVNGTMYRKERLSFAVEAPNGFELEVLNGEMEVKPRQKFQVTIAGEPAEVVSDARGILTIPFGPINVQTIVEIKGSIYAPIDVRREP